MRFSQCSAQSSPRWRRSSAPHFDWFESLPNPMAKRKATPNGVAFFLAEDEGFEPPQTESESGVLPLH